MQISQAAWNDYIVKLSKINQQAAEAMKRWINLNGYGDFEAMAHFAHAITNRYGSAAASLACEMYDATAAAQGAAVASALPAEMASIGQVRHQIGEAFAKSASLIAPEVGKMVKQAGADTMLQNAARDNAEWAWIPHGGETCAWCIVLASKGWQKADKSMINNHAEHIHANCKCEFAVRFDGRSGVSGYHPRNYEDIYRAAGGVGGDRINALRRALYEENKEQINAQKRAAYAERMERRQND